LEASATGESMRITIADNGPGVVERVRERIGEPFVTTKPEGTGLGIAVAKEIIAQHGGTLSWQRVAGWTRFEIRLPRLERSTRDLPPG
jgi:nitrogen-specific signal transduction histidine kinase